ncbi:MAG: sugar ABC transporter substrate-binding protein [Synergistaceae bacterium]|nr:sugar ABC transporter substrate-binding protein [Synergistaceae bacterium]
MKKFFALILIVGLLGGLAAGASAAEKAPKDMTFAFIIPALDANWYVEIVDSFKYAAEEIGANVLVLVSDYDVNREIANIDLCVTEQVDGLCMFSFNENGAALAARKMQEAGIPLVVPDSVGEALGKGADLMACVDFDWYKMGEMYAEWMAANTKGDYVIITGNFEHFPCIYVNKGMDEKSKALGVNNQIDIRTANYNPDRAAAAAEDLVSGGLEFETIFVMQEEMAAAVVRVLEARGVLNNPYRVITQNGQDMGIDLVREGKLSMTISSSPGLEGYICFRMLYSQIMGKINYHNEQKMVPIAAVLQKDAENRDPRVVIPWHRNPIFKELTAEFYPELMWY